jgi:hypothetical protein
LRPERRRLHHADGFKELLKNFVVRFVHFTSPQKLTSKRRYDLGSIVYASMVVRRSTVIIQASEKRQKGCQETATLVE